MTELSKILTARSNDFVAREKGQVNLFLCKGGVKKHWEIPNGTKRIEVHLHNKKPTRNAHRFRCDKESASPGLFILPEEGETGWDPTYHGTYWSFGAMLAKFRNESGDNKGWMEIKILE